MSYYGYDDNKISTLIICIAVLIFGIAGSIALSYFNSNDTVTATVTDKGIKRYINSDKYLVYTEEETFEITDNILIWRWDSSDQYGQIELGKTYEFDVVGWRIPFLSMYRNIISAEAVP